MFSRLSLNLIYSMPFFVNTNNFKQDVFSNQSVFAGAKLRKISSNITLNSAPIMISVDLSCETGTINRPPSVWQGKFEQRKQLSRINPQFLSILCHAFHYLSHGELLTDIMQMSKRRTRCQVKNSIVRLFVIYFFYAAIVTVSHN